MRLTKAQLRIKSNSITKIPRLVALREYQTKNEKTGQIERHTKVEKIGHSGYLSICELLRKNHSVTSINFCRQNITKCSELAEVIVKNKNLKLAFLDLSNNDISSLAGWDNALINCPSLEVLKLDNNKIRNISSLAKGLTSKYCRLKKLYLDNNHLNNDSIKILAVALKYNNSLEGLSIRCNRFGNRGLKAIADALKQNHSLKKLRLENNRYSTESIEYFCQAMKYNDTLIEIDLIGFSLSRKKLKLRGALNKKLKKNKKHPKNFDWYMHKICLMHGERYRQSIGKTYLEQLPPEIMHHILLFYKSSKHPHIHINEIKRNVSDSMKDAEATVKLI